MTPHRRFQELPTEIPLRCWCGRLHGTALGVEPKAGCRVVCYCDDCQAFARFLKRPGITDEWGGTDLFQLAPANLRILDPSGALECVRLTAKGMVRWYCGECKTPVGNTVSARVPFVGLIHAFMDHESDGRSRDEVLGKPGYSQAKFAAPGLPRDRRGLPLGVIVKVTPLPSAHWQRNAAVRISALGSFAQSEGGQSGSGGGSKSGTSRSGFARPSWSGRSDSTLSPRSNPSVAISK